MNLKPLFVDPMHCSAEEFLQDRGLERDWSMPWSRICRTGIPVMLLKIPEAAPTVVVFSRGDYIYREHSHHFMPTITSFQDEQGAYVVGRIMFQADDYMGARARRMCGHMINSNVEPLYTVKPDDLLEGTIDIREVLDRFVEFGWRRPSAA